MGAGEGVRAIGIPSKGRCACPKYVFLERAYVLRRNCACARAMLFSVNSYDIS